MIHSIIFAVVSTWEQLKEIAPHIMACLTAIFAWKKEYVMGLFQKKKNNLEIKADEESVEAAQIENVSSSVRVLKELLDISTEGYKEQIAALELRFKNTVETLKSDVDELNIIVVEQKKFIEEEKRNFERQRIKCKYECFEKFK